MCVAGADLAVYMYLDNKRRDRKNGEIDARRGAEAGMLDLTEVRSIPTVVCLAVTDWV